MTATLSDMINEVYMNLSGYTLIQDRATYITSDVANTASTIAAPTVLSLASSDNLGKGVVEINEELFWVDNYDRLANTATISPYGRAYLGTTLAAHTAGDKVTISPVFPRFAIKRAINDTISAIGSSIFAAATTTITYSTWSWISWTGLLGNRPPFWNWKARIPSLLMRSTTVQNSYSETARMDRMPERAGAGASRMRIRAGGGRPLQ